MRDWKEIGKKLLFPPIWLILLLTIISTITLVMIFVKGWEMHSMLFLETAMFAQFGTDTSQEVKRIMIMATGAAISVIVISMVVYMIVKTTKEIKQLLIK